MKEIEKVLDLLLEGKVTKEQALKLIEAVLDQDKEVKGANAKEKRSVKIEVIKNGKSAVSINLPMSILKFALKTAKLLNKNYIEIDGNKIPIDIAELENVLTDPDFKGKLIDVNAEDEGEEVKVLIEII